MKRDHSNLGAFTRIRSDIDLDVRSTILVVGELREWLRNGFRVPMGHGLAFLEFEDLTQDILQSVAPGVVLSPLLSRSFDCVEVAERLWETGYRGQFRALADRLPNPGIVRSEIKGLFPGLDFDIVGSMAEV